MKKGQMVRLIQPVIQGEILKTVWDEEAEELAHLVEWTNESGEVHQRLFRESELEEVNNG